MSRHENDVRTKFGRQFVGLLDLNKLQSEKVAQEVNGWYMFRVDMPDLKISAVGFRCTELNGRGFVVSWCVEGTRITQQREFYAFLLLEKKLNPYVISQQTKDGYYYFDNGECVIIPAINRSELHPLLREGNDTSSQILFLYKDCIVSNVLDGQRPVFVDEHGCEYTVVRKVSDWERLNNFFYILPNPFDEGYITLADARITRKRYLVYEVLDDRVQNPAVPYDIGTTIYDRVSKLYGRVESKCTFEESLAPSSLPSSLLRVQFEDGQTKNFGLVDQPLTDVVETSPNVVFESPIDTVVLYITKSSTSYSKDSFRFLQIIAERPKYLVGLDSDKKQHVVRKDDVFFLNVDLHQLREQGRKLAQSSTEAAVLMEFFAYQYQLSDDDMYTFIAIISQQVVNQSFLDVYFRFMKDRRTFSMYGFSMEFLKSILKKAKINTRARNKRKSS